MGTMHTAATPTVRDIVLVGGGHSHVVALRYFAMHPLPGVRSCSMENGGRVQYRSSRSRPAQPSASMHTLALTEKPLYL
jgi:hypothetical protein